MLFNRMREIDMLHNIAKLCNTNFALIVHLKVYELEVSSSACGCLLVDGDVDGEVDGDLFVTG